MDQTRASFSLFHGVISALLLCALMAAPEFVSAQTSAVSPDAAAQEGGLQEIVVQAQRRSENQQTIPVTVSSLDVSALAQADITSALDLGKLVPSLALNANSGTVLVFLRGIGSNNSAIGEEASVALYVDGVYYSRLAPSFMRFNSIDHVEVLNGPQGTLFGRNASGGLVNVITRDPHIGDPLTVDSTVSYGNYQTVDASTYAASGIGSKMAVDFAANYHDQGQGWGTSAASGEQLPVDRSISLRSKWVAELTDTTSIKITGEYMDAHEDIGQNTNYIGIKQGYADGSGLIPFLGFYTQDTNQSNEHHTTVYGTTIRLEQDLGFSTLVDTAAYHRNEQNNPGDLDSSPLNFEVDKLTSNSTDLLNELQLLSKPGSAVDWVGGLFYMDEIQTYEPAQFIGTAIDGIFGPGGSLDYHARSKVKSIAPYGQARFEIIPKLKATLGIRYTRDQLSGDGFQGFTLGGSNTVNMIPGTAASSNNTFTKVTWKGGLDYQFTDSLFGYATVSRGYKGATLNMLPFSSTPVQPEVLDSYEIGVKSEWFEHRLRVNAAAYYYKLTDPQVIVINAGTSPTVENAGSAKVKGFDVQAEIAPIENLIVRISAAYVDATYSSYADAPFYAANPNPPFYGNLPPVERSATGNSLPDAPKVTFNFGGEYHWTLPNEARLAVGGNYAYSSKVYFQPDNAVYQGAYGLLDAHLSYDFQKTPLAVKFWGANLANKQYYNGLVEFAGPVGDFGFIGAPRTYGVTLSYKYK